VSSLETRISKLERSQTAIKHLLYVGVRPGETDAAAIERTALAEGVPLIEVAAAFLLYKEEKPVRVVDRLPHNGYETLRGYVDTATIIGRLEEE